MKKSKSSHQWLKDHEDDEFVKRARAEGFRSRASYKLLEIDEKFSLIKPRTVVVDLGAAPGGWCQVARQRIGPDGMVLGIDLLEMEPIDGVILLQGDFTLEASYHELLKILGDRQVDLVISDMAPNLSGMKDIDQPRSSYLVELAIDFADEVLMKGGNLVCKCFEGLGVDEIRRAYQSRFVKVVNFKPKASRDKSREIYVVGLGYKPGSARQGRGS